MRTAVTGAVRVALVLSVALLTAACSGGGGDSDVATSQLVTFDFGGTAATVAGDEIPAQSLADTLAAFEAAPAAVRTAFGQDELFQAGSAQPQPAIVANILSTEIAASLIQQENVTRGLTVTPDVQLIAETQIKAAFGDSLDTQVAFRDELIGRYTLYVALDQALAPPAPDEAALRQAYDADPSRFGDQACARHILVATEPEANDIVTQLGAGADFSELAQSRSTDPGSGAQGGDLGCVSKGSFVPEFETAVWEGPLGQVQGPVETQFGYHVIVVDSRGQLSFAEARDQIESELTPAPFSSLRTWLDAKLTSTPVTVDGRFGTWNPEAGSVDPLGVSTDGLEIRPAGTSAPPGPSTTAR